MGMLFEKKAHRDATYIVLQCLTGDVVGLPRRKQAFI